MCMQRHSTFISLVAVFKFLANGDRSQKVVNAILAYLRAFSYLRLDFVRSRTQPQLLLPRSLGTQILGRKNNFLTKG